MTNVKGALRPGGRSGGRPGRRERWGPLVKQRGQRQDANAGLSEKSRWGCGGVLPRALADAVLVPSGVDRLGADAWIACHVRGAVSGLGQAHDPVAGPVGVSATSRDTLLQGPRGLGIQKPDSEERRTHQMRKTDSAARLRTPPRSGAAFRACTRSVGSRRGGAAGSAVSRSARRCSAAGARALRSRSRSGDLLAGGHRAEGVAFRVAQDLEAALGVGDRVADTLRAADEGRPGRGRDVLDPDIGVDADAGAARV